MGNRAVIAFHGTGGKSPCVYVHWNGGRASVEGFLRAAKRLDIEPSMEEFHRLVGGFLGSSAYLEPFDRADKNNGDNGVYFISHEWDIVSREHQPRCEEPDFEKTHDIAVDCIAEYLIWT